MVFRLVSQYGSLSREATPNFVESPKTWAEGSQYRLGTRGSGGAECEASKGQAQSPKEEGASHIISCSKQPL
jgi:hypothetical protein